MSVLARLQKDFFAALFDDSKIDGPLAIYRRTVNATQRGALASIYPVVLRLVGDAFFTEAARQYARVSPSTSGDLNAYGAGFADFLASYPHAASLPYLPDVACLEWALHESHDAADAPAFDFTALVAVPQEAQGKIRLRLHPSVRLVESRHPILALWQANQPDRDGTPDRTEGGDRVRVVRNEGATTPELADGTDWTVLTSIARGATLEQIAVELGDEADLLGPALVRFASAGVVCGFEVAR